MLVFRLTSRKEIKPTPFLALYALIFRYKIVYYCWRICCVADNIVIQILLIFNLTEIDEDFSAFRIYVRKTTGNTNQIDIDIDIYLFFNDILRLSLTTECTRDWYNHY